LSQIFHSGGQLPEPCRALLRLSAIGCDPFWHG
jgi:hypothetical protein